MSTVFFVALYLSQVQLFELHFACFVVSGSVWKTRDQIVREMDMFDCRMQEW